jgi:hypothetical protein
MNSIFPKRFIPVFVQDKRAKEGDSIRSTAQQNHAGKAAKAKAERNNTVH